MTRPGEMSRRLRACQALPHLHLVRVELEPARSSRSAWWNEWAGQATSAETSTTSGSTRVSRFGSLPLVNLQTISRTSRCLKPLPDPSLIHLAGAWRTSAGSEWTVAANRPPTGMPLSWRSLLSFLPCCVRRG